MSKKYLYPMNLTKEKMKTDDEYFIGFKSDKRIFHKFKKSKISSIVRNEFDKKPIYNEKYANKH